MNAPKSSAAHATPPPRTQPPAPPATPTPMPCTHPRVQKVSHSDDADYVECLECREVFEASEFHDMDIEEKLGHEEEE